MIEYSVVSLRDVIDVFGLESILDAFESFSCENEKDLEVFYKEHNEISIVGKGGVIM